MKKNIALLLGLILGLGFVSCSSDDDDDENVNGEDKYLAELLITRYDWKDGKRSDEGKLNQLIKYNKDGRWLGCEYNDGTRDEYTYDDNGDCIEKREYNSNNTLIYTSKYEYNYVDSFMVMSVYNWKNELVRTDKNEYSYDEKLIKCTEIIDSIGKDHGSVRIYSYSETTVTMEETNLKDGSFMQKYTREYDSYGNITKMTTSYRLGSIHTDEFSNEYDSNGRLLKKTMYDGVYGYTEYTYNDDGTIKNQHCVNGLNTDYEKVYDLEYTYKYKKK
jgi:hypothetical protein